MQYSFFAMETLQLTSMWEFYLFQRSHFSSTDLWLDELLTVVTRLNIGIIINYLRDCRNRSCSGYWLLALSSVRKSVSWFLIITRTKFYRLEFEMYEDEIPYVFWSSNCVSYEGNMFIYHEKVNGKVVQWVTKPPPLPPEIIENVLRYLRIHCLTHSLRFDEFTHKVENESLASIFTYMEYGRSGVCVIQPLEIF